MDLVVDIAVVAALLSLSALSLYIIISIRTLIESAKEAVAIFRALKDKAGRLEQQLDPILSNVQKLTDDSKEIVAKANASTDELLSHAKQVTAEAYEVLQQTKIAIAPLTRQATEVLATTQSILSKTDEQWMPLLQNSRKITESCAAITHSTEQQLPVITENIQYITNDIRQTTASLHFQVQKGEAVLSEVAEAASRLGDAQRKVTAAVQKGNSIIERFFSAISIGTSVFKQRLVGKEKKDAHSKE